MFFVILLIIILVVIYVYNFMQSNENFVSGYDANYLYDEKVNYNTRNQNCDEIIRALLDALNNKIRSVNQILRENLDPAGAHHAANQGGGANDDKYMSKYLKYKNKYLSLKKMI